MKLFLKKYIIGLTLISSFVLISSALADGHTCHPANSVLGGVSKGKCSKLMCVVKDCDIVCKAHCKHD